MNVIVCIDDRSGMLFNHRRQSQDRVLRQRLLAMTEGRPLCMNPYSAKQFSKEDPASISVSPEFLENASGEDYCFVEERSLLPFQDRIQRLILCRWNRAYPGDFFLDLPLDAFHLVSAEEFPGSSHEKITMEVYEK